MASPRVIASPSSANADLVRQPPLYPVGPLSEVRGSDQTRSSLGSINMEELLRNFYADSPAVDAVEISPYPGAPGGEEGGELTTGVGERELPSSGQGNCGGEGRKTEEEVWGEISGGHGAVASSGPVYKGAGLGELALEAFLARAGPAAEEDVAPGTVPQQQQQVDCPMISFVVDPSRGDLLVQQQQQRQTQLLQVEGSHVKSGNGVEGRKKKAVQEPLDKVAQQKQRRRIKNRESAARSRERKQAYTADLEKLVAKLEEENARLVRQQEEQNKARLKQLMENLIPVDEGKRPPRPLRRTCSMHC